MQRKRPLHGKIFARCIPKRLFAGLFGCMARISCQSQPVFGCMARESCHELAIFPSEAAFGMHGAQNLPRMPPENAPRRNLATDRRSGTHRARILPLPVRPRAHQGAIPPPSDAGKRISRAFCHRRAPGNAPWRNIATTSRPRTHSVGIPPLPVARSRSALYAREWVQSLGCAVGFGAQRFLCKGVGIPPSRGLTAGNDFESALFRWATMSPLRVLQSCAVLCAEAKNALTFI